MKKSVIATAATLIAIITFYFIMNSWFHSYGAISNIDTIDSETTPDIRKVVRVGYPIQQGLTEVDKFGNHFGYTVDYLNEISKYTGWQYEFVQVEGHINDQLTTLLEMMRTGEIDMMGAMNRNDALEQIYLYPSYSYGTGYTVLAVREDNSSIIEGDHRALEGLRIAIYPGFEKQVATVAQLAEIYDFTYELVNYETFDEMVNAVHTGNADACIQMDLSIRDGLRSVARFVPRPYYFAVNRKREDLLIELNDALSTLSLTYPHLQTELYNRYFNTTAVFQISDANAEYIKSLGTLNVLFYDGNAPLQYVKNDEVQGVSKEFIDDLCKATGLKYQPIIAHSAEEGAKLIQNGKVDMAIMIDTSIPAMANNYLKFTMPYMDTHSVLVSNDEENNEPNQPIQSLSANTERRLRELLSKPGDKVYLDSNAVSFYMRKSELFGNLTVNWSDIRSTHYAIAVKSDSDPRLVALLNNYINSTLADSVYESLYRHLHQPVTYSLPELIYTYRHQITFVTIGILSVVLLLIKYQNDANRKRSLQESIRFLQMAKLFNECLFEYSYDRDELAIQNNELFFPGISRIENFSRPDIHQISAKTKIYYHTLLRVITEKLPHEEIELPFGSESGWFRIQTLFTNEKDRYALGRITNITTERTERHNLEEQAHQDQLTGLANRYLIENVVSSHIDTHKNTGIFMLLDIDNFKQVNDQYGHLEGDALLRAFSRQMDDFFCSHDLKGRIGGDEFIVFIAEPMDEPALRKKLEQFILLLRETIFKKYEGCKVSVSIGAAYLDANIKCYDDAYRKADDAMYCAKSGGKNAFCIES